MEGRGAARAGALVLVALTAVPLSGCGPEAGGGSPSGPGSVTWTTAPPYPAPAPPRPPAPPDLDSAPAATTSPGAPSPVVATQQPTPSPACARYTQGVQLPLSLVVTVGRATVSWPDTDDPDVVDFRLGWREENTRISTRPDFTWRTVRPVRGCSAQSQTVTGLVSGRTYVFALEADIVDREAPGLALATTVPAGASTPTVAQGLALSGAVLVP